MVGWGEIGNGRNGHVVWNSPVYHVSGFLEEVLGTVGLGEEFHSFVEYIIEVESIGAVSGGEEYVHLWCGFFDVVEYVFSTAFWHDHVENNHVDFRFVLLEDAYCFFAVFGG